MATKKQTQAETTTEPKAKAPLTTTKALSLIGGILDRLPNNETRLRVLNFVASEVQASAKVEHEVAMQKLVEQEEAMQKLNALRADRPSVQVSNGAAIEASPN
jgi:hypothetical protein